MQEAGTFQFTPLREGRPRGKGGDATRHTISIHAPPRGATATGYLGQGDKSISIHAPPRGATYIRRRSGSLSEFQFTPLREGRRTWSPEENKGRNFNSRPSARGDARSCANACQFLYFNSRPSARGDEEVLRKAIACLFQFTPLREGRLLPIPVAAIQNQFQFTPLREGRPEPPAEAPAASRFQFTPLREGRQSRQQKRQQPADFNSRPSARGDGMGGLHRRLFPDFNSRPSARGDYARYVGIEPTDYFNSRPSARGDLPDGRLLVRWEISIHAPPRGATREPTT